MPDWREETRKAARRHQIDVERFYRQIQTESNFDPNAYNRASGATGIAQIVPRWHPGINARDPLASLEYAARWMASMIRSYGNWIKPLIAYNWGSGNLATWSGRASTLPQETQQYLAAIVGPGWRRGDTVVYDPVLPPPSSPGDPSPAPSPAPGWADLPTLIRELPQRITEAIAGLFDPDKIAGAIWKTFDIFRLKIRAALLANGRALAAQYGGPVAFWIVGSGLIVFGLLGLAIAGAAAAFRSRPGRAGQAIAGAVGGPQVKAGLATAGAIL